MYWAFDFQQPKVEQVLDRPSFNLADVLDEEDCLQEVKALNKRVVSYLTQPEVTKELLEFAAGPTPDDADEKRAQKVQYIASEVLTCDVRPLSMAVVESESLLDILFAFLHEPAPVNPLRVAFACKVISSFLLRLPREVLLLCFADLLPLCASNQVFSVQLWAYMNSRVALVPRVAEHIGAFPVRELLMRLLAMDDPQVDPAQVRAPTVRVVRRADGGAQWFQRGNLVPLLVERLSLSHSIEVRRRRRCRAYSDSRAAARCAPMRCKRCATCWRARAAKCWPTRC
jgi:SIT4-associating protein SAP185/190